MAKLAASVATAVIIVAAVMSWMQNRTPVSDMFGRLAAPLLAPVRKLVPLVGGIDLSPLLVIVALQVIGIVLGSLQASLWGGGAAVFEGGEDAAARVVGVDDIEVGSRRRCGRQRGCGVIMWNGKVLAFSWFSDSNGSIHLGM